MTKFEAPTLEEAYTKASLILECSISELKSEIVQYPSKGILGILQKNAIIIASIDKEDYSTLVETDVEIEKEYIEEKYVADEIIATVKEEEKYVADEVIAIVEDEDEKEEIQSPVVLNTQLNKDPIVDNFFQTKEEEVILEENVSYPELAMIIENQLKDLISHSCFDIDVVEVDVIDDTALIFIDGEDAALLIGKEGYRYNALAYMIFNWLHAKYELFIKLEIAEFLTKQHEMIKSYIQPIMEDVEKIGRGRTRFLDGILVQIALEQLREIYPNKYVAVKTTKNGKKFVIINEFNTKKNG